MISLGGIVVDNEILSPAVLFIRLIVRSALYDNSCKCSGLFAQCDGFGGPGIVAGPWVFMTEC